MIMKREDEVPNEVKTETKEFFGVLSLGYSSNPSIYQDEATARKNAEYYARQYPDKTVTMFKLVAVATVEAPAKWSNVRGKPGRKVKAKAQRKSSNKKAA